MTTGDGPRHFFRPHLFPPVSTAGSSPSKPIESMENGGNATKSFTQKIILEICRDLP
jgi:hypothetical protein